MPSLSLPAHPPGLVLGMLVLLLQQHLAWRLWGRGEGPADTCSDSPMPLPILVFSPRFSLTVVKWNMNPHLGQNLPETQCTVVDVGGPEPTSFAVIAMHLSLCTLAVVSGRQCVSMVRSMDPGARKSGFQAQLCPLVYE